MALICLSSSIFELLFLGGIQRVKKLIVVIDRLFFIIGSEGFAVAVKRTEIALVDSIWVVIFP